MLPTVAKCFMVFALPALLGGCGVKQAGKSTILISDGCVVYVEGATAVQAKEMTDEWDISDDCEVKVGIKTR